MDDGNLLRPAKLNFDNFMICLNNLHPLITHMKKQKLQEMKKEIYFKY